MDDPAYVRPSAYFHSFHFAAVERLSDGLHSGSFSTFAFGNELKVAIVGEWGEVGKVGAFAASGCVRPGKVSSGCIVRSIHLSLPGRWIGGVRGVKGGGPVPSRGIGCISCICQDVLDSVFAICLDGRPKTKILAMLHLLEFREGIFLHVHEYGELIVDDFGLYKFAISPVVSVGDGDEC